MSLSEGLISFSVIMLMLSFISERVSNLIKLYFQDKYIGIPFLYKKDGKWNFFLSVRIEILAIAQPTKAAEKEREYRLLVINIFVGVLVAMLTNVDFFEIVKAVSSHSNPGEFNFKIGWDSIQIGKGYNYLLWGGLYFLFFLWSVSLILFNQLIEKRRTRIGWKWIFTPFFLWIGTTLFLLYEGVFNEKDVAISILTHTLGYLIIGVFLSLGSKFWHDLLDLLFKVKQTRYHLGQSETYTDYDSSVSLMNLAETSQYEIVEGLYDKYDSEIWKISGIVSCGINVELDEQLKIYRRFIEVEYTTESAQKELENLYYNGYIQILGNTFLLRKYMKFIWTEDVAALSGNLSHADFFAYNDVQPGNQGTFGVFERDGVVYAESNLHVLATDSDLERIHHDPNNFFQHRIVTFKIGNIICKGEIVGFAFGNGEKGGMDYCECRITDPDAQMLLSAYNTMVEKNMLSVSTIMKSERKAFGHTSGLLQFINEDNQPTKVKVNYRFLFGRELTLIKIIKKGNSRNADLGDSGAILYYKNQTTDELIKGMIVARSNNYAYMFPLANVTNKFKV